MSTLTLTGSNYFFRRRPNRHFIAADSSTKKPRPTRDQKISLTSTGGWT